MVELSRRTALWGALGVAGASLVGCTPATPAPTSPAPAPSSAVPTPSPKPDARPRWPLTGALLKDPAKAAHAAVAVKVPDNKNEHPQVGLDQADIVFVQLDGYRDAKGMSGTRLVPVFHSSMADDVAPVRSIRPVDIPLLSPLFAVIGNTGGGGGVLRYARKYETYIEPMLSYVNTKGTGSYSIDPGRVRVYQGNTYYDRAVVCHPKILAKQTPKFRTGPRQPYFPFAIGADVVSTEHGESARTVGVPWGAGTSYSMGYNYDKGSGRYLRSMPWGPHVLANGKRVTTDNILVIRAKQHYAPVGGDTHAEPIHDIIEASGPFMYFHGGAYVQGTWSKAAVDATFQFTLADGSPLKMAPGRTFVELANSNAKVAIKG